MRHRVRGRKLNRSSSHRLALKRNLSRSLFMSFGEKEHIVTTLEKAKFVKPFAEKLITLAKNKTNRWVPVHGFTAGLSGRWRHRGHRADELTSGRLATGRR